MKIKVIASGSKGNCTIIKCGNTKLLIDIGISLSQVKYSLENIDISIDEIDGILISHTHSDHVKGLVQLVKKNKIKVYSTIELFYDLVKLIPADSIVIVEKKFNINDVDVSLIETSHDVISYGFVLKYKNKELVYITDTGYINKKHYSMTENKDIYIIESNHDEKMLMNGPYPYHLKQRVIGDKGHLSNHYAGKYLAKVIGDNTKYIFLAHISENNNTYDLALNQVKEEIQDLKFDFDNIIVTHQEEETDMIEV